MLLLWDGIVSLLLWLSDTTLIELLAVHWFLFPALDVFVIVEIVVRLVLAAPKSLELSLFRFWIWSGALNDLDRDCVDEDLSVSIFYLIYLWAWFIAFFIVWAADLMLLLESLWPALIVEVVGVAIALRDWAEEDEYPNILFEDLYVWDDNPCYIKCIWDSSTLSSLVSSTIEWRPLGVVETLGRIFD